MMDKGRRCRVLAHITGHRRFSLVRFIRRGLSVSVALREGQPTLHAVPFRVNDVGAAALPVWLAWKPKLVVPPLAGMVAL